MTTEEFDREFDIQFNNIASDKAPGLDTYEKSVFLTKAQEAYVLGIYNGSVGVSFEEVEQARRILDALVETKTISTKEPADGSLSTKSSVFKLPTDLWFITYESAKVSSDDPCMNGKEMRVIPVTQDDFHTIKNNPFKGPNKRQVLRLDKSFKEIEIVSNFDVSEYLVRYIRKPRPIILDDIDEYDLTINGENKKSECELADFCHNDILSAAVMMAVKTFQ